MERSYLYQVSGLLRQSYKIFTDHTVQQHGPERGHDIKCDVCRIICSTLYYISFEYLYLML